MSTQTQRRERGVREYCRNVCPPRTANLATAEILGGAASGFTTDDELLRRTRIAAANHAPVRDTGSGWRGVLAAEHEEDCDATPRRLAARANGDIDPPEQDRLEQHLGGCLRCAAAELKMERAERAFSMLLSETANEWFPVARVKAAGSGPAIAPIPVAPPAATSAGTTPANRKATGADPSPPAATRPAGHSSRLRKIPRLGLVAVLCLFLASIATAPFLLAHASRSTPASRVQTEAVARPAVVPAGKHVQALHRHPARRRHAPARKRPTRAAHAAPAAASSAAPADVVNTPPPATAPVARTPVSSATPAAPSASGPASSESGGSAGGGGGGGGGTGGGGAGESNSGALSATVQGGALPPASAPTQGIGSGGTSKH
jgi:hypothetical protein